MEYFSVWSVGYYSIEMSFDRNSRQIDRQNESIAMYKFKTLIFSSLFYNQVLT